jgi:hypothetical protein
MTSALLGDNGPAAVAAAAAAAAWLPALLL